jgi:hypothetical protein
MKPETWSNKNEFQKRSREVRKSLETEAGNNENKINENKINENKINENKINENKINENKINENKINENKINENKIIESKINTINALNEINEIIWKYRWKIKLITTTRSTSSVSTISTMATTTKTAVKKDEISRKPISWHAASRLIWRSKKQTLRTDKSWTFTKIQMSTLHGGREILEEILVSSPDLNS